MIANRLAFIEPFLSLCFFVLGASSFTVIVTLYLKEWGQSEQMIGFVQSAYFAGLLLGGVWAERFISRTGHIRCYAAFASVLSSSMLAMGLIYEAYTWFVLRLIFGFGIAALYVVIESWLLAYADKSNRGRILAFYMVALYLSQAVSQALLVQSLKFGIDPFMAGAILASLSVIPLALSFTPPPPIEQIHKIGIAKLLKLAPFGVAGCLIGGVIQGGVYAFIPSFALATGHSAPNLMAITILGGGIMQWPIGKLSDLLDRRRVLYGVSLATIIPCILMFYFYQYEWAVQVLCFALGGFSFALYPLGISQTCDRLQAKDITSATAVLLVAYGVGSVIGPVIAPWFMDIAPVALFAFYALTALVLVTIGFYSIKSRPPVPLERQSAFVAMPSTTTVASELDPRAPHEGDKNSPEGGSS